MRNKPEQSRRRNEYKRQQSLASEFFVAILALQQTLNEEKTLLSLAGLISRLNVH